MTTRLLDDAALAALTVDAFNFYAKTGRANWSDAEAFKAVWNRVKVSTSATIIAVRNGDCAYPFIAIVEA